MILITYKAFSVSPSSRQENSMFDSGGAGDSRGELSGRSRGQNKDTKSKELGEMSVDRDRYKIESENSKGQVESLSKDKLGLEEDKKNLLNQIADLTTDKSRLQEQLTGLESDKKALEVQVTTLQATIDDLMKDKETWAKDTEAKEAQIAGLDTENGALKSQIESISKEKEGVAKEMEEMED